MSIVEIIISEEFMCRQSWMNDQLVFDKFLHISQDPQNTFQMAFAGCIVIPGKSCASGVADIKASERNRPIKTTNHGSVSGLKFSI